MNATDKNIKPKIHEGIRQRLYICIIIRCMHKTHKKLDKLKQIYKKYIKLTKICTKTSYGGKGNFVDAHNTLINSRIN